MVLITPITVNSMVEKTVYAKQGWQKEGNTWYYYNQSGSLVKNAWAGNYWLGADGKMSTNSWVDNNKYYVGNDGFWVKNAKKTGWQKEGNTWYYYNQNGTPVKNTWVGNYYLGKNGAMLTNSWVYDNNYRAWYYLNQDGSYARNKWAGNYWLGADGKMSTNSWVDNNRYYVGSDGKWIPDVTSTITPALNMPQYCQGDPRWGSRKYGFANMKASGCVPTSLSMIFTGLGKPTTPVQVADIIYNETNEMNVREIGTTALGAAHAIKRWGFSYSVIQSKEQLISVLQKGQPVYATVGSGIFTRAGLTHAIVLSGYNNGKTKAMDPDSSYTTGKWYDINTIWNQRSTDPSDTRLGGAFIAIFKN